jgi:hypothetical protein
MHAPIANAEVNVRLAGLQDVVKLRSGISGFRICRETQILKVLKLLRA